MKVKARHTFFMLSILFLAYSFSIYTEPLHTGQPQTYNKQLAADGRLVWQSYNCQSCHQLYGLGGYLGPDLTNLISPPGKGEAVLRAMVKSGIRQMPSFHLEENEMTALIEFLKSTDASGSADPKNFSTTNTGMIEAYENE